MSHRGDDLAYRNRISAVFMWFIQNIRFTVFYNVKWLTEDVFLRCFGLRRPKMGRFSLEWLILMKLHLLHGIRRGRFFEGLLASRAHTRPRRVPKSRGMIVKRVRTGSERICILIENTRTQDLREVSEGSGWSTRKPWSRDKGHCIRRIFMIICI